MLITVRTEKGKAGSAISAIKSIMNSREAKKNDWTWVIQPKAKVLPSKTYDEISFQTNSVESKIHIIGYLQNSKYWYRGPYE